MTVKKKTLLWLFMIIPFFYPSFIAGSLVSIIWYRWKMLVVVIGTVYIFRRIRRLKSIESTTWAIIAFYVMQLVATAVNGLDLSYDINTLIMTTVFLLVSSLIIDECGNRAIRLFYSLLNVIIWLNFFSVILLHGKGLALDSYNIPIYFWSTKNHIISITIAYLFIAKYMYTEMCICRIKYISGITVAIIATVLMGSSTAITALAVYGIFILYCYVLNKKSKSFNIKFAVIIGVLLDIAIVLFRIQERFAAAIASLFGKDATLTGRTDLWDQAIKMIGINPWFGKGNSYALVQYGWLTKQYWNNATQTMEDTYFVAHNQFLEIMLNGGIICLVLFFAIFICMINSVRRIGNNKYKNYICAAVLAYFIAMITDLISPYEPLYLFLIVCSYIYKCEGCVDERK